MTGNLDSPRSARDNPRPMTQKRPFFLMIALAATLAPAASCTCSGKKPETRAETLVERSQKLPNGLGVDLAAGPCGDSAAIVVLLHAGIDHDPADRSGMAHVAGRALASSAPAGNAARTVETGDDYTLYSVVAAGDRLLAELDEVAAWMSQRTPSEADFSRAKKDVLADIAKQQADAQAMAVSFAEEAVQPTRGNGKRRGVAAEVEAITPAELTAFWQSAFKPGNARITIAGRFDAEKVRAHIEKAFGGLPAGTPPAARPAGDATVKGTLVMGDAPKAVAIAVPAPAQGSPLYPAFLVLASRLLDKPAQPRTWEVSYDPIQRPELLFITGPVGAAEQPEPAAGRMRAEVAPILARPPAPEDISKTKERFRLIVEPTLLDPAICAKDTRAFAVARARRPDLKMEGAPLRQVLETTTKEHLDEAAKHFDVKRTAAVIAGGSVR